jgi:N-acetyl-1-D-myo-inositol-2-amino-2-deoxy-alpha-D-glucopyranoside deacetylase
MSNRSMIFFGAHPDDESFGIGSTLAQYADAGVSVYYVCSTGGEVGTVAPGYLKRYGTVAGLRAAELACAARELGLAEVIYLGYRDSGMRGAESNRHPDAMAAAPIEEITGRVVKIMRRIRPEVVITHDAGGGYGHPDHVATHHATVRAFSAAGDPAQYPDAGPAFQPRKLYVAVRPRGVMKLVVRLMPLFGQNPRRFGRNKDIDLTRMLGVDYPVHAVVRLSKQAVAKRNRAAACHASQGGGRFPQGPFRILRIIEMVRGPRDYFMRVIPAPTNRRKEKDLFAGPSLRAHR